MSTELVTSGAGGSTETDGPLLSEAPRKPISTESHEGETPNSKPKSTRQPGLKALIKIAISSVCESGYRPMVRIIGREVVVEGVGIDQPDGATGRLDVFSDDQFAEALGVKRWQAQKFPI